MVLRCWVPRGPCHAQTEGFLFSSPQDPPSEPGSPGRSPSRRPAPSRRELPESPASIGSSGSTTPKEQNPVRSPLGSLSGLGVGMWGRQHGPEFLSVASLAAAHRGAQKCQWFVPTATPHPGAEVQGKVLLGRAQALQCSPPSCCLQDSPELLLAIDFFFFFFSLPPSLPSTSPGLRLKHQHVGRERDVSTTPWPPSHRRDQVIGPPHLGSGGSWGLRAAASSSSPAQSD